MRKSTRLGMAVIGLVALTLVILNGCTQGPLASSPEEFYRGSTVTWISATDAGSPTDLVGRAVAPYLAKELGATVKVENMGGDEGINWVYNDAKRDGLTLLLKATSAAISNDVLKAPGVLYEAEKFSYVADVFPAGVVFATSPKLQYKTLDALRQAKGLKAGATSVKGSYSIMAAVSMAILGLDGKIISGYKGGAGLLMALAQGEVDFKVSSDSASQREEADGTLVNLLVMGNERSRVVPNVPTLSEAGVKVPKELEDALAFIANAGQIAALPPDVAPERVEYLRKAYMKVSENKDLQKEVERLTGVWSPFKPGKDIQATMVAIKANKGLAAQLDTLFDKYKTAQ